MVHLKMALTSAIQYNGLRYKIPPAYPFYIRSKVYKGKCIKIKLLQSILDLTGFLKAQYFAILIMNQHSAGNLLRLQIRRGRGAVSLKKIRTYLVGGT